VTVEAMPTLDMAVRLAAGIRRIGRPRPDLLAYSIGATQREVRRWTWSPDPELEGFQQIVHGACREVLRIRAAADAERARTLALFSDDTPIWPTLDVTQRIAAEVRRGCTSKRAALRIGLPQALLTHWLRLDDPRCRAFRTAVADAVDDSLAGRKLRAHERAELARRRAAWQASRRQAEAKRARAAQVREQEKLAREAKRQAEAAAKARVTAGHAERMAERHRRWAADNARKAEKLREQLAAGDGSLVLEHRAAAAERLAREHSEKADRFAMEAARARGEEERK
jgi:colicin import membrane protein